MNAADAWRDSAVVLDESACPICQREGCEGHEPAVAPGPVFLSALDVIAAPCSVAIVEGIVWSDSLSVLVSESGTGKTFVLLDLAASISAGIPWHGRHVRPGSVAYVSYEGDALGLRLRALHDVAGHNLEHVYVLRASEPLSPLIDRNRIELPSRGEIVVGEALETLSASFAATDHPPIVLLAVDTVRASLVGSEDSSESVSAYLRSVRRLMGKIPGAACILAHHAGWQDGEQKRKRERGSSAFRGNVDATCYLEAGKYDPERREAHLTLHSLKVRDDERPAPLALVRRQVELAEADEHGQPVTSCLIERDRRSREDREAESLAAVEAAARAVDQGILQAILDRPDLATSQDRLRVAVNVRKTAVNESCARLIRAGWITPGRRGQPYQLTPAGHAAMEGQQP